MLLLQGDHIKTWRRRWFVLKQGYMFRFATPDVSPSTKPRGLVDLSKVSDVTPAKDATGRNNSLMLSTPTGRVLYVADSETEQVEWLSAIEGAVTKIVRQVCAVAHIPSPPILTSWGPHIFPAMSGPTSTSLQGQMLRHLILFLAGQVANAVQMLLQCR